MMQLRSESTTKPTIILFNLVLDDGIGDLWHLIEIYKAFTNDPRHQEYEFTPVIKSGNYCSLAHLEKIEFILKNCNGSWGVLIHIPSAKVIKLIIHHRRPNFDIKWI